MERAGGRVATLRVTRPDCDPNFRQLNEAERSNDTTKWRSRDAPSRQAPPMRCWALPPRDLASATVAREFLTRSDLVARASRDCAHPLRAPT